MATPASLILHNARVLTMDPVLPLAEAVAVRGDRILAVGRSDDVLALRSSDSQVIDCRGLALLPGLVDAHCHLLPTASALSALDCTPAAVPTLAQLQALLARRAGEVPAGQWLRGFGLDPAGLAEGRFPTRWELDAAAPDHPVRLEHDSGHGAVLNSLALRRAGIDADTPDPPEGVIEREESSGQPTGLLLELAGFLRQRLGPTRSWEELAEDVSRLSQRLLSYGITSVQDAGPANGLSQWQTFRSLSDAGKFLPRITMMAGAGNVPHLAARELGFGAGDHRLRVGHAKIMLTLTTGALQPGTEELRERVSECQSLGFPAVSYTHLTLPTKRIV